MELFVFLGCRDRSHVFQVSPTLIAQMKMTSNSDPLASTLQLMVLQGYTTPPGLSMCWGLNPGPYSFWTSTLPTELHPAPKSGVKRDSMR